jgi:hypothetical protein
VADTSTWSVDFSGQSGDKLSGSQCGEKSMYNQRATLCDERQSVLVSKIIVHWRKRSLWGRLEVDVVTYRSSEWQ